MSLAIFVADENATITPGDGVHAGSFDSQDRRYKMLPDGQDRPEVRSAVDRYQSAILMPARLMKEAEVRLNWRDLYRLAGEAQVNITLPSVRLQRLGIIYLRDSDERIYRSKN
jgi:hypothetical protein